MWRVKFYTMYYGLMIPAIVLSDMARSVIYGWWRGLP